MQTRLTHARNRPLASLIVVAILGVGGVAPSSAGPSMATGAIRADRPGAPLERGQAGTTLHGDINGDGFSDLAVGIDGKTVGSAVAAGQVSIIYGSGAGLSSAGNQLIDQDTDGMLDQAETGDQFARYMGGGDFNGDGFFDLAIGVPLEDVDGPSGSTLDAGAVQIVFGSASGRRPWATSS